MSPLEMHIGIDLILQKVNSNFTASFSDEQKDWFLTEEMFRFLRQRTRSLSNEKKLGLEDDQMRYDDLEALITPMSLPVYPRDSISVYSYLPHNYFTLHNSRSLTKDLCGSAYAPATTNVSFYSACYNLPPAGTLLQWYTTLVIHYTVNGGSNVDISMATIFPGGLPSSASTFEILYAILEAINAIPGFEAKFEGYKDKTCNGGIVITSDVVFTLSDTYITSGPTNVNRTITITTNNLTKITPISGTDEFENRLCKTDNVYKRLKTNFDSTLCTSPFTSLEQGKLIIYHNKNFIVSSVNGDYLRRPKKISLTLNQACELGEDVHQEIVDNTGKRLAALTLSETYKNIINENLLKE